MKDNNMVLYLRDWGVMRARRRHQLLRAKRVLARGTFCAVFEGSRADTVLKLTLDRSHYVYMTDSLSPQGTYKPRLIEDFGAIGQTTKGHELYLIEVERLEKLPRGNLAARVARRVVQHFRQSGYKELPCEEAAVRELDASFAEFLSDLNVFITNFGFRFDGKVGNNFMYRPSEDQLVVSDPVFDAQLLAEAHKSARNRCLA